MTCFSRTTAYSRMRRDTEDETIRTQAERTERINLGLALLSLVAKPGVSLSRYDIACWCGCTDAGIYVLERAALRKLRKRFKFGVHRALGREVEAA